MRWSIKEDKILAETLIKNGISNNKSLAFQEAANRIGVTKSAVMSRYHRNKKGINEIIANLQRLNSYFEEVGTVGDFCTKKRKTPWYVKLYKAISSILDMQKHI